MNPNNIKVGDTIEVQQAWEDEAGQYHDEFAEVNAIEEDGRLDLGFPNTTDETNTFLRGMDYFAKDYKPESPI